MDQVTHDSDRLIDGPQAHAIDYFSVKHPLRQLASRASFAARKKMFAVFMDAMQPTDATNVLDVGITPDESLPESNFFELLYPHPDRITATSIEDARYIERRRPGVKFVRTDGKTLPFEDKAFDIAASFAVLEHVGDRAQQQVFIAELLRVGKTVFLTTPNRSFPIEVHTFIPLIHWLPQATHQSILKKLGMDFWAQTDNLNLVNETELRALFPADSELEIRHNKTAGMSSNLIAIARKQDRKG